MEYIWFLQSKFEIPGMKILREIVSASELSQF